MTDGLSDREKALVFVVGSVALVVGIWVGVWTVPVQALDVPTSTFMRGGEYVYEAAYRPVPPGLPFFSVLIVGVGAFLAKRALSSTDDLDDDQPASTEVPADD